MAMADIQVLLSLLHALVCAIHFDLFVYNIQLFVPDTYIRSCFRNPEDLNPNPTTELEKIVNDLRIKYRTYAVDLDVEYVSNDVSVYTFYHIHEIHWFNC